LGGGLMALFGYLLAQKNNAERGSGAGREPLQIANFIS